MPPFSTFGKMSPGDQDKGSNGHSNEAFVEEDDVIGLRYTAIHPNDIRHMLPSVTDTAEKYTNDAAKSGEICRTEEDAPKGGDQDVENLDSDAKPAICPQVVGVLMASLAHVGIGAIVGLPGVTLPQLTNTTSTDIVLDSTQVALFGSLVHIGAIVGSIFGGVLNLRLGQRVTLLLALPLALAMWLALSFSTSVWMVQVVRTLLGVTQGLCGAASNNYVVEVAHTSMRGRFAGFVDTARQLGFLFVYIVGSTDLSWRHVALVCGIVTTVPPFIGLFFLPNSPRWLVTQGRSEEAQKALRFYRGQRYDLRPELSAITEQFERTSSSAMGFKDQLRLMGEESMRRRLILLTFLMFILQFTGNITIATYVVDIMNASKASINAYTSAILVGGVRVIGTVAFLLFVDRVGRKAIVLVTSAGCTALLVILGIYFYLHNNGTDLSHVSWLPIATVLVYMPLVCALEAVTCLFRGELLPTSIRAVGVAFLYLVFFLGMFACTFAYPSTVATIGQEGAFWLYAAFCVLLAAAVVLWVPETRGLSLEQIDDYFRGKSSQKTPSSSNNNQKDTNK